MRLRRLVGVGGGVWRRAQRGGGRRLATSSGGGGGGAGSHSPPSPLSLEQLDSAVRRGEVSTVAVGFTDMYGRMMGKRMAASFFMEECVGGGTHCCDYLLACDMDMTPIAGFKFANWERGYGDMHVVPDMASLRMCSWTPRTALVLADVIQPNTHNLVTVAPRSILRAQLQQLQNMGYRSLAATELEYYTYKTSYNEACELGYDQKRMKSVSNHVEDYHLLQTSREEPLTSEFRRHLELSGIPVETSKGEAGVGQHELNVKYDEPLAMSDRHVVYKQCLKEVADAMGQSVTFMAKPFSDATGSGCHVHLSLWNADDPSTNAFVGDHDLDGIKCSNEFRWFLGGWMQHTPACMPFYAPTVNSYKRYQSSSWAPTRLACSYDNRTAGFRVVGSANTLRIECRIAGADVNPYLVFAASLASGLDGIRQKIEPPPLFSGNIYEAREIAEVPKSLPEAVDCFENSDFAKEAFGRDVVEHYAHFYRAEHDKFHQSVTDWERSRYFEMI